MTFPTSAWRSFRNLESNREAASASACCDFSLATLEVAHGPSVTACFGLTEKRQAGEWRWAVCSAEGIILQAGFLPTQTGAKEAAEAKLRFAEAQPVPPL